ncbi:MAG: sortase [Anaerolineae bacterium]|jgi:LPXTG-site transpeptidase (sortase) family protein|nr:sortase [Anaerolineae bacterium]
MGVWQWVYALLIAISWYQAIDHPRLVIPSIEVISPITSFPLGPETWEIDPWEAKIGHFEYTGWRSGNMVLGGHVEYPDGSAGIFRDLQDLQIGDRIVFWQGLQPTYYRVIETKLVNQTDLTVLYPTPDDRLTLITCDARSYQAETGEYLFRWAVIATLEP